jgi:hypothetical protein
MLDTPQDVNDHIRNVHSDIKKLQLDPAKWEPADVEKVASKAKKATSACVAEMKKEVSLMLDVENVVELLDSIHNLLVEAWAIDTHGHVIGTAICDGLRTSGGLDLIFDNCISTDERLVHHSMKLLEQALTVDNRSYLACQGSGRGLQKVLKAVAKGCYCTPHQDISTFYDCEENCEYQTHDPELDVESSRVRTGILEHMFKDSEATCLEVVKMGGLKVIVSECRKRDVETLRHCASALANLSLYGGSENHQVRTVWITIAKQKFS